MINGLVTALLLTDGTQRKRKDDGELEGKPAKRTSATHEDDSVPGGVDDVTATTDDVWVRRKSEEADSKSAGSTATKQSNGDDIGNSDSTNGSDSEVFLIFHFNLTTLTRGLQT